MRRTLVAFLLLGILAATGTAADPVGSSRPRASHVPGELLVGPARGVPDADLEALYRGYGARKSEVIGGIRVHRISVPLHALEAIESALRQNPKVDFVEKNFIGEGGRVPNDPGYPYQWHLPKVSAPAGWDVSIGAGSVVIAVVDSGVDPAHPDLAAKLVPGWSFLAGTSDTRDVLGHGTAVAGTAAAISDEGLGAAGLAWGNPVMPLVVLSSSNSASYSNIAKAITYAADRGARVVTISIGGTSYSSTLQNAVNYAWTRGLVVVACAMNAGTTTPYYPAALQNVLAVAATDEGDLKAGFSNYGSWIDLAAPGTSIYTTANGGGHRYASGTSFSAPQVAALAALTFSANPGLTNAQVVNLILDGADDLGAPGDDDLYGAGRMNVARTLQAALDSTGDTPDPSGDTLEPSVAITAPGAGSTVSGTVTVQASAQDETGVARVELWIDGALAATDTSAPYTFAWNTAGLTGSHTLVAVAHDGAGNSGHSAPVTVTVASGDTTPPSAAITGLVWDGRFLKVEVSASDPGGSVVQVELLLNGTVKATDSSAPWAFKVNGRQLPSSTTVTARARDSAGNVGVSAPVALSK